MTDFAAILEYYPLPLAAKHLDREETELFMLAHVGIITVYQCPDSTTLIEWEKVNIMEIGSVIQENTKTGRKYRNDIAIGSQTQATDAKGIAHDIPDSLKDTT